ncbi:MAG: HlyD family efflux transporter periplasmic adaptor subunit [Kiritimatiellae bacterium]|nr:HlyD family efflux transporter periplasmic adaptor subunit [Kiritimatiellia bacterium]
MNDTQQAYQKPKLNRRGRIVRNRFLRQWPLLFWAVAIAASVFLYNRTARFGNILGAVETVVEELAPVETARLLSIEVVRGQHVRAGQIIARLDTTLVDVELAEVEVSRAQAENDMTRDMLQTVRQIETAVKEAEAFLSENRLQQQSAQGELDELNREYDRLEKMMAKQMVTEEVLADIRPRIAALEVMVKMYPDLITVAEEREASALRDREQLIKWIRPQDGEDVAGAASRKLQDMQALLDAVRDLQQRKLRFYELKATKDSVVSAIFNEPGEVIAAGAPVIRLVQEKPSRVIGFLPEAHVASMREGQEAWVWRKSVRRHLVSAVVETVSPEVDALPGRVSPIRAATVRGRRVVLRLTGEHDFIPGESVQIRTSLSPRS